MTVILGGDSNTATSYTGIIGGGAFNKILDPSNFASILGGGGNSISLNSSSSSIVGGEVNTIIDSYNSFLGGGYSNYISEGDFSVLVGGRQNNIANPNACCSFIGGGCGNLINNQPFASILGGKCNQVCSGGGGSYGTILGGEFNLINQLDKTFIVGSNITANRQCTTFVNNISIMNIPTSSTGLPSGSVWRNPSTNVLCIVP
jgi:hypothetical protein